MDYRQFEYNDISVVMLGQSLATLQGISLKRTKEKEFLYGRGSKPIAIQSGNEKIEGNIKILQSDLIALLDAAKAANVAYNVLDLQFDVIWNFNRGAKLETHTIVGVQFTEYGMEFNQGDKNMVVDLPYMALSVQHSV